MLPVSAYVAVGANLGDRLAQVRLAVQAVRRLAHTQVRAVSPLYQSAPWEAEGEDFFNAVMLLQTDLSAPVLLAQLHAIEAAAARSRPYVNAPRTLDLDLLLYDEQVSLDPRLRLPHPRMQERAFVLRPLLDIWPEARGPKDSGLGSFSAYMSKLSGQILQPVAGLAEPWWDGP